jgi:FlaA1/EpsC-like NDP-sugar epimerase
MAKKRIFGINWIHNRYYFLISDIIIAILCVYLSYVIRIEVFDMGRFWPGLLLYAFLVALMFPFVFYITGIYSIFWEYASVDSIILLIGSEAVATILVTVIAVTISLFFQSTFIIPRSIPIIFFGLVLILVSGSRMMLSLIAYYRNPYQATCSSPLRRVLIMGAGRAGSLLIGEIRRNSQLGMNVIGCLDDNPAKLDKMIHGVKVLGNKDSIPFLLNKYGVDEIIITMPSAHEKQVRSIVNICRECKVNVKIMPGIYDSCFAPLD